MTPVQKICQYPLQLKELIKPQRMSIHPDHSSLEKALAAMKRTAAAAFAYERKRKMESLEKLSRWHELCRRLGR